ncbi:MULTISPECIES: TIGR03086 family metal-binding protein [unclassified Streptosporangium]|uniref:TIGR03086 family metal-binding protein n=1 Tax=unclassified Streptosporangium TaxID=2632669 RepID=UPI002E27C829|nr:MULTISPECIES: TIGR03086 family metal-binding protein [unclassified Streptosporangium]
MNEMLSRTVTGTATVARGVRDDQLDLPTPCDGFDIRELLGHLAGVAAMFEALARREEPPPQDADHAPFEDRATALLAAWSAPGVTEGTSPTMGMPMVVVLQMLLGDLAIHGWDLARATGQDYEVDAATGEAVAAFMEGMAPQGRRMGAFGEEVPVPEDASPFERALGLSGRDPAWKP